DTQGFGNDPCQIARTVGTGGCSIGCDLFLPAPSERWLPLPQTERRHGGTGRVGVATGPPAFLFDRRSRARHPTGEEGGRQGDSPHTSIGGRAGDGSAEG